MKSERLRSNEFTAFIMSIMEDAKGPASRGAVLAGVMVWLGLVAGIAAPQNIERPGANAGGVLKPDRFKSYVDTFNADDNELYQQFYPNAAAWDFLKENIPLFECPDQELEKTYYFRWWTYRKHIRQTPDGIVITEFLPDVPWAGKHNTIPCPAGHHFYEGRWLKEAKILDDYAMFWFRKGGEPRKYSFWAADALWARYLVTGNPASVKELLPDLAS